MDLNDYLIREYDFLTAGGLNPEKGHHEHSKYEYDTDGIAINKGDWLLNRWTGRGAKPTPDKENLKKLIYRQASLECNGGWIDVYNPIELPILKYYLDEYYINSIEFFDDGYALTLIDTIVKSIFSHRVRLFDGPVKQSMLDKGGKVHVLDGDAKKYKKGEKIFNYYWMEKLILDYPGHTPNWYGNFSREWAKNINGRGWNRSSFERFFKEKKVCIRVKKSVHKGY